MTREHLDELWTLHRAGRKWVDVDREHLLQAAERALRLESVLEAALHVSMHGTKYIEYSMPGLRAAIDRVEDKP